MDFSQVISVYAEAMWVNTYYKVAITMFVFYLVFAITDNPTIVDFGYCTAHFVIGANLYIYYEGLQIQFKETIIIALLFVWYLRLGGFIFINRILAHHKDPRYEELVAGKNRYVYFLINFQFQGLVVMLTSTPLFFDLSSPTFFNPISFWVGVAFVVVGIIGEAISDSELESFKKKKISGAIYQEGLWTYSRHPNLFFELITWFGFGIIGINNTVWDLLGFVGPIILFCVMNFLTIPITEASMQKRRANIWDSYVESTNKYLPLNIGIKEQVYRQQHDE